MIDDPIIPGERTTCRDVLDWMAPTLPPLYAVRVIVDETTALLIRARGYIERGWCKETHARNADGHPVDPTSEDAVAWCADGALLAAGLSDGDSEDHPAVRRLIVATGAWVIWTFNDAQETVETVLAAFDRAIAMVQQKTPEGLVITDIGRLTNGNHK